jgi:hypothetical protein
LELVPKCVPPKQIFHPSTRVPVMSKAGCELIGSSSLNYRIVEKVD